MTVTSKSSTGGGTSDEGKTGNLGTSDEGENKDENKEGTEGGKNPDVDKIISERDKAKDRARLADERATAAEKRAKDLEDAAAEEKRLAAEKSGNIDEIKSLHQKELEREKSRADEAVTRSRNILIENVFRREASDLFIKEGIDDGFELIRGQLEVKSDDDGDRVVVKGSALSVSEFLKKWVEDRPHYAKNAGAAGSGTKGSTGGSNQSAKALPTGFDSRSKEEQRKWFAENPDFKITM